MIRLILVAALLAGCAAAPVPPEVRARGEAMLAHLRALDRHHTHHCEEEHHD